MAKVSGPFNVENAENSAIAVQHYKNACEYGRILDRVTKSAVTLKDLHQLKIITYRSKLKDICERLMFVDPIRHGKKAEEILWKKVYYDVISLAKKLHKVLLKTPSWTRGDQFEIRNHIRAGLGTYYNLIFRLQSEYVCVGGDSFTDFILPISFQGSVGQSFSHKGSGNIDGSSDKICEWALQAYQRCLICMGDLARYNLEFFGGRSVIPSRYYHQALLVCSESTMPFNQLGTLYSNSNYGFDSVYFYMRCTFYNNGFDGASANLNRTFERNRHWLETTFQPPEDEKQNKIFQVRQFLCKLIKYAEFVYKHSAEEMNISIGELCETVIVDFHKCLELKSADPRLQKSCCSSHSPCHLSDNVIFKMFIVAIMCVEKLQTQDSSNTLAATAFVLASLSHLLNHILICMEFCGALIETEGQLEKATISPGEEKYVGIMNLNSSRNLAEREVKNEKNTRVRKPKKLKVVRPRKKGGFDDSDLSEGGETSDEDKSDDENGNEMDNSDSSIDAEDGNYEDDDKDSLHSRSGSSANSDCREMLDEDGVTSISNEPKEFGLPKNCFEFQNKETPPVEKSLPYNSLELLLSIDQLLITVKVCCDWLEAHSQVIIASAQGSQKLWARFVTFINLLVQIVSKLESSAEWATSNPEILHKVKEWSKDNWKQDYPLPEDLALRDLNIFSKGQRRAFSSTGISRSWLSEVDQILLRTASLRHFFYDLSKNSKSGIEYVEESGKFIYTHFENQSADTGADSQQKGETQEQKQNLMQNMAQLWLEAEVKELESSVQLLDRPRFSPYLIPDISVLLTHLDLIAQLMASKIFIFILPIVALQHLDEMKKESSKARKAIRWLETEFQKHNRYLRAQKRHERVTLPLLKYPKRRDKEAWNVFSILECAKYFSRYGSNDKSSSNCLATILVTSPKVANAEADEPAKPNGYGNHSLLPLARSSDLKVENVVEFFNKWKSSTGKVGSGKKVRESNVNA